jgi:hypothetical protein
VKGLESVLNDLVTLWKSVLQAAQFATPSELLQQA